MTSIRFSHAGGWEEVSVAMMTLYLMFWMMYKIVVLLLIKRSIRNSFSSGKSPECRI